MSDITNDDLLSNPLAILESLAETDLTQVDTSFPNLAPGQYEFVIDSAELKTSDSGGCYLLFGTKLVSPDAKATSGEALQPGYPVRLMINLTPSQKQLDKDGPEGCKKRILGDIAKFTEAVTGPQRKWFGHATEQLAMYRGAHFFAKTRVSQERTDPRTGTTYAPQTEFAALIPKAENDDYRDPS